MCDVKRIDSLPGTKMQFVPDMYITRTGKILNISESEIKKGKVVRIEMTKEYEPLLSDEVILSTTSGIVVCRFDPVKANDEYDKYFESILNTVDFAIIDELGVLRDKGMPAAEVIDEYIFNKYDIRQVEE